MGDGRRITAISGLIGVVVVGDALDTTAYRVSEARRAAIPAREDLSRLALRSLSGTDDEQ